MYPARDRALQAKYGPGCFDSEHDLTLIQAQLLAQTTAQTERPFGKRKPAES